MHNNWKQLLSIETKKQYFWDIRDFLKKEIASGKKIYPNYPDIFNAYNYDPQNIKCVILGQDPYHNPGQAHGLSFSVLNNLPPPSLKNIFKELEMEGFKLSEVQNGNLTPWALQGVFLLNSFLTVEENKPKSHQGIGWDLLTDETIKLISKELKNVVFLLWGSDAIKKSIHIDKENHLVLTSPHPSPLSAYRGFLGNNHFNACNDYLVKHQKNPIIW